MECYWFDPYVTIYRGDVREVLRQLPKESVHSVVTSPPYLGLRQYTGASDQIWGGSNDCEHQWQPMKGKKQEALGATSQLHPNLNKGLEFTAEYSICSKCGAFKGQFGQEPRIQDYVDHTIEVLRLIKRVLRKDGTVWWNIGDSYCGDNSRGSFGSRAGFGKVPREGVFQRGDSDGLGPLNMCMIPFRVADAAQRDGWIIRLIICWDKVNPMPESVSGWRWERHRIRVRSNKLSKVVGGIPHWNSEGENLKQTEYIDCPGCPKCSPNNGYILKKGSWRPTRSHEYIIMMSKSKQYYGDADSVREPLAESTLQRVEYGWFGNKSSPSYRQFGHLEKMGNRFAPEAGHNLRSVWTMPTEPNPQSHFAVFPESLPRKCVLASTSEAGCCPKCGAPWVRVSEKGSIISQSKSSKYEDRSYGGNQGYYGDGEYRGIIQRETKTLGWKPSCKCNAGPPIPCTVMDPFSGTGTTGKVAKELHRKSILIDISADYCKLAKRRVEGVSLPMEFNYVEERQEQQGPIQLELGFSEEEELPDF